MNSGPAARPFDIAFGSLLGLGGLVRVWMFLLRGALSNDEAGLALNVVGRGWLQVARPFVYQQHAPYLYLLASKALTSVLGPNAHMLRMSSLACGIALLPLMLLFVQRASGWSAALFGLALLVPNALLMRGASEFSPGASDTVIAAGVCLLTTRALAQGRSTRWLAALGCAGFLAPWLSLPAIFVLAGSGAALCVEAWERDERRLLLTAASLGALWLTSFALHHLAFLQPMAADAELPQQALMRKFFELFELFAAPAGLRFVAAGLWAFGTLVLWRSQRSLLVLLCTPLMLTFAAAGANKYLLADRQLLFLLPSIVTPVVSGLAELAAVRGRATQLLAASIAVLFCAAPSLGLARTLAHGPARPGIDLLIDYLEQHWQPGDRLYVETRTQWQYTFYARRAGFDAKFPISDDGLDEPKPRYTTLDSLMGAARVWVLVPAARPDDVSSERAARTEMLVTTHLEERGRMLDAVDGGKTRLYLYNLSQ